MRKSLADLLGATLRVCEALRARLAFQLGAEGRNDRAIAQALNAAGYRTTGNRDHNPFTKDTVRVMLRNRFYLGELPGERPADAAPVRHEAVMLRSAD